MKRILILVLVLCLCFPAVVSAESLFPSLSTPEPAATSDKAPSYGAMANVDPDNVRPYAEGGQVVTYENVDEQGYNDFGVYLNSLGYEVTEQAVDGRTAGLKLTDGNFNIGLLYYGDDERLLLIYEEGVEFEKRDMLKAYYPDAIRFELGEEIEIKGLGKFTFTDFKMGTEISAGFTYQSNPFAYTDKYAGNTYTIFDYYNTSSNVKQFNQKENGMLYSYSLDYINADGIYHNSAKYRGSINQYKGEKYIDRTIGEKAKAIAPLSTLSLGCAYQVPEGMLASQDGCIVLDIVFKTDKKEHYILVLREDGVKVGDW